jgi:hypothetical protein
MAIEIKTRLAEARPLTAVEMDDNLINLKTGVESVESSVNTLTGSISALSSSVSTRLNAIEGQSTSSLSGSLSERISTLETTTADLDGLVDGVLEYTASNKDLINDLLAWTASNGSTGLDEVQTSVIYLNLATSSLSSSIADVSVVANAADAESLRLGNDEIPRLDGLISELQAFTESLNLASASFGSDNTALNNFTESVSQHITSVNTFTGSISSSVGNTISDLATLTTAANTQFNSLFASSSLITSSIASIQFSVDSINSKTGSFGVGGAAGIFNTGSQDPSTYDYWLTENNLQVSGTLSIRDGLYIDRNLVLSFDSLGTSSISSDIIPDTNSLRTLGTETSRFKTIFVDNLRAGNGVVSGSSQINGETLNNLTLTNTSATGSFTGSFSGSFNGLFTGDASGLVNFPPGIGGAGTDITLLNQHTASINEKTGSYATTGSNTFEGKITVNDDIEATGAITASAFKATGGVSGKAVVSGQTELILRAGSRVAVSGSFNLNPTTTAVVGSTPADGDMYFDLGSQTIYFGKNGTWNPIHSGSSGGVGTYSDILDLFIGANPLWDVNYQIVSESNQMSRMLNGEELLDSSSLKPSANILNSQLANSSFTINGTPLSLGGTITGAELLSGTDVISGSDEYNTFESSFYAYTASINSYTGSLNISVQSGSFASTGSNNFIGTQSVTGSILVSGSLLIDLSSGSAGLVNPNYLTITNNLGLTNNFRIGSGPEGTGSYVISSNLYYVSAGATKDNNDVNGWQIRMYNTDDNNRSFSIDHSPKDSTAVDRIIELRENASSQIQTLVNSDITIEGNINATNAIVTVDSINATNQLTASAGLFDSSLIVSGTLGIAATIATSSMVITQLGYVLLPHVSESLDFASDALAAAAGVPIGGLYRNGNALAIRID